MKLPQTLFAAALLLCACAAPAAQRTIDLRAPAIAPAPTAGEDGSAAAPPADYSARRRRRRRTPESSRPATP